MKKTIVSSMVFLLIFLMISSYIAIPVKAEARSDVDVTFYGSPDAAWTGIVDGQIDFMQWSLTKEQKEAAEADPNIQLCRVDENGIFEFDVNNNYTIPTYPGIMSPTNHVNVRQAIAHLIDKYYILTSILLDYGVRIDVPIPASQSSWWNENVTGPNYPFPFNPEKAAQLLAELGFADTDGNGWLNYPDDWPGAPGADTTVYPLVVCVRSDHAHRKAAGIYLINQLEVLLASTSIGAGFKTTGNKWIQPRSVLAPKIMAKDYHIYTGGWSVGKWPPVYMFSMFHSRFWCIGNIVTGVNSSGLPNYPDLDEELEKAYYAPDIPTAMVHCKNAQWLLVAAHCVSVWLWSYRSYWAYRKGLVGVCNMDGYGLANPYTFLNAYRVGGGPIRVGVVYGPSRLNILYSQEYSEYCFLNIVYNYLLSEQPYNIAVVQPWVAQDWDIGTWDDDGITKTMVTFYIRKDVGIVSPVTGDYVRRYTAHDVEFTIWYTYAFDDCRNWASVMDVRYTRVVDVNGDGWEEIQIYFDELSFWLPIIIGETMPLLVKSELLDPLCAQTTESWAQIGTNEHVLTNSVVQVVSASLEDVLLVEGVDYIIRAGHDVFSHKVFVPLHDLTGTISITYWYPDIPATGFYLAGLPWQTTMYGICTHYPVSMTTDPPGVGDTIVLKKNPFFFTCPVLLGEVDWAWKWVGTTKPRSGYYKIEIYDVVRATGAYCTRGDGVFNPKFFPGADLDAYDLCHIGIFDLVIITGKYGRTFGVPPESYHELMGSGVTQVSGTFPDLVGATDVQQIGYNLNISVNVTTGEVTASLITTTNKGTGQVIYNSIIYKPARCEKINIEVKPPVSPPP